MLPRLDCSYSFWRRVCASSVFAISMLSMTLQGCASHSCSLGMHTTRMCHSLVRCTGTVYLLSQEVAPISHSHSHSRTDALDPSSKSAGETAKGERHLTLSLPSPSFPLPLTLFCSCPMSRSKKKKKSDSLTAEGGRGLLSFRRLVSLPLFRLYGRLGKSIIRLLFHLIVLLGRSASLSFAFSFFLDHVLI